MKSVKIEKFNAWNIGALDAVQVKPCGKDVAILGANGTGKTTIKKALMWLLNGKTIDGEKLIPLRSEGLPKVEVQFNDGITLTKELKIVGKSATTNCYINGNAVSQREYEEALTSYGSLHLTLELGNFFTLRAAEQREILMRHFGVVQEADVIASDEELTELQMGGLKPDVYMRALNAKMRQIKLERSAIPKQISELEKQIVEVTAPIDLSFLEGQLESVNKQVMKMRSNEVAEMEREYKRLKAEYNATQGQLNGLKDFSESVKEGVCPTCGHALTQEKTSSMILNVQERIALGEKKLIEIAEQGKAIKTQLEKKKPFEIDLNNLVRMKKDLEKQLERDRRANIAQEVQQELNEKNERRISELKELEKEHGREMVYCERQYYLVDKFIRRLMEMEEDAINKHFSAIKFKMYETLKNGEVRNICEAEMNGVPYSQLSKGEKLKAALDAMQTFQECYGVAMPLIIDDAESYTSNSLLDLPNQVIGFRVKEGGLTLNVV